MKVYVAGVVSLGGKLPIEAQRRNATRFFAAEERLLAEGHEVINPLRLNPVSADTDWQTIMRSDLKALLDCDAIYMLRGWEVGVGPMVEFNLAVSLKLKVMFE